MDSWRSDGFSEDEFARFVGTYRELCSRSWRVYVLLAVDYVAKCILWASWFDRRHSLILALIAVTTSGLPLMTYFVMTFCRLPPPLSPRVFGRLIVLLATWTTIGTGALVLLPTVSAMKSGLPVTSAKLALLASTLAWLGVVPMLLNNAAKFRQVIE